MTPGGKPKARANLLHVDLKDLKEPWSNWCASKGLTPSEAVRRVLREALALNHLRPDSGEREGSSRTIGGQRRLEIRMSPEQYEAVRTAAILEGLSLPRWLQALIVVHLQKRAQYGPPEVEALSRSSQALLAIGRNINQIARNMHDDNRQTELSLAQLNFLRDLITDHTREVAKVLASNRQRWQ